MGPLLFSAGVSILEGVRARSSSIEDLNQQTPPTIPAVRDRVRGVSVSSTALGRRTTWQKPTTATVTFKKV